LINQKSVILSFISFKNGSVKKIYGLDECFSTEGVEVLRLQFNEGDDITDITTDGNRHGFIISSGNNKAEALKTVSFVKQKLTVKYNDQA